MDYRDFLHELFDTKPEDSFINIWISSGKNKRSKFFKDIDKAADYVLSMNKTTSDIYVGCGFLNQDLGAFKRGTKRDIAGLPGFGMDIDLKSKDKPDCPATIQEAVSLVKGHGYDPTIIIFTGNGIHVWWLFKECWEFEKTELQMAENVNRRLQQTIKQRATEKGWKLDATHDVTRVLRLPNTFNFKDKDNPKETSCYENGGPRYEDHMSLDAFSIDESQITSKIVAPEKIDQTVQLININKNADPPTDKMDDLMEIDVRFKSTWQQLRTDMQDQTPSAYAMALANAAAQANWSDQEITNLIFAFYRRHGHDTKSLHKRKIALTIAKARQSADNDLIEEFAKDVVPTQGTPYENIVDPGKERSKKFIKKNLKGLELFKLLQYKMESDSHYRMILKNGNKKIEIPFTSTKEIRSCKIFCDKIYECCHISLHLSRKQWEMFSDNLVKHIVLIKVDFVTPKERLKYWIEQYLQDKDEYTIDETLHNKEPFVHANHWHIYGNQFYTWTWQTYGQTQGNEKTKLDFKIIKAKRVRFNCKHPDDPNKTKTIRPWRIPLDIVTPTIAISGTKEKDNLMDLPPII
jgi:hypothetical protein